jgi:hypothetical protein
VNKGYGELVVGAQEMALLYICVETATDYFFDIDLLTSGA